MPTVFFCSQTWANDKSHRDSVESTVQWAYYGNLLIALKTHSSGCLMSFGFGFLLAMYGLVILMAFLVVPLSYFYFDARDDDRPRTFGQVRSLQQTGLALD